jgi:uncharacterized protein involved in exopolysaccharide biosynthesis
MALPIHTDEIHLRDYLLVLRKRRWLALATFATVFAVVAIWTFAQTPIYEGAVKVLIDREPPRVLSGVQEVTPLETTSQDYYQTQYEILKSRPVLERTIESLGLVRKMPRLAKADDPVKSLALVVQVEPKRNTRLVDIKVRDADPALAAEVANGLAKSYARFNLESKLTSTREAMLWLSEQMNELKAKVQDSEVALQKYREKSGIVGIEQQRNITATKMMEMNRAYLDAQAQRLAAEARLKELTSLSRGGSSGAVLAGTDSPILTKLRGDSADLEKRLSEALKVYKEKHPEVVKVRSALDQVNDRIRQEVGNSLKAVESEYKVAKSREDALGGRIEAVKREALDLNEKEIQYGALSRETQSNQQLYEVVLKRVKETGLSGGLETNNIRIVEEAQVPRSPVRPRIPLNLALGLVVGLMLAVGLAFFVEYFDNSIKTPDEVERYLGLPALGVIPMFEGKR